MNERAGVPMKSSRRWSNIIKPVLAVSSLIAVAGCAKDAPQDTWQPAGPNAKMIDDLQRPIFYIAGIVGVIVFAAVAWAIFRFRDRGQAMPEQTHGKPALEITLTVIPVLILIGVGVPTVGTIFDLAKTDDTEMTINVTGQQWWWEYDYPAVGDNAEVYGISDPIVTSGQLVIPEDTKVLLRVTSRDVIHSYWIPKLNGKKDSVPGRVHLLRMEGSEPGIYAGQCTEFCGLSHAYMRMEAVVLSKADYATWVANQLEAYNSPSADNVLAVEGEKLFLQQCARCHQVNGLLNADGTPNVAAPDQYVVSGAAPNLTNLMTRNTFAGASWDLLTPECRDDVWNATPAEFGEKYLAGVSEDCLNQKDLREWLRNAPEKKPMYADPTKLTETGGKYRGMPALGLTEDQISALVAYLLELK
ncbi:MAG: cytochrome c oxidase subunit II [Ilumatobacteraceae bacterium]|nr:cytochrome c oxidase subunit II [Ilumatobacteraceae bacterium]